MSRPRVVVVQQSLRRYRVPFFEQLRQRLDGRGIALELIYGEPEGAERSKRDAAELAWGTKIRNRSLRLGRRALVWQPCLGHLRGADLVVVEQASRLLLNYLLLAQQSAGARRVALWGHGRNLQAHRASALGERVKRAMSREPHWWFAYNDLSAAIVASLGYPRERITSVQNAIDTRALRAARAGLTEADLAGVRAELGVEGDNVCVFSGGLYADKRLGFLIEACDRIRERVPDFEMIVVGDGPDAGRLRDAAMTRTWLHLPGARFGPDKVPYFALSKLFLLPGLVGLGILDAFALEVPLVTTDVPFHSPEIAYLEPGENGVLVGAADDAQAYAREVARLLEDADERARLAAGCRRAADSYTVEAMAVRFEEGVVQALGRDAGAARPKGAP